VKTSNQNARAIVNQGVPVLAQCCRAIARDFALEQHLKGVIVVNQLGSVSAKGRRIRGQRIDFTLIIRQSRIPLHNRVLIRASLNPEHPSNERLGREILGNLDRPEHTIDTVQNLSFGGKPLTPGGCYPHGVPFLGMLGQ
jgi:hypothetical protein